MEQLPFIVIVVDEELTFAIVEVLPVQLTKWKHTLAVAVILTTCKGSYGPNVPIPGSVTVPPVEEEIFKG